jgi:hypothetical protein
MRRIWAGMLMAAAAVVLLLGGAPAAQAASEGFVVSSCGTLPNPYTTPGFQAITVDLNGNTCINGSLTASLSGFTPNGNFATLTATNASGSVALPTGAVVYFQNTGTTTVSCTLGVGSATATTNEIQIPASSAVPAVVGTNTYGACIDQTGSTSNLVVLAGGAGLANAFGGGGGGGSGGSVTQGTSPWVDNITQWASTTLGVPTAYGTAPTTGNYIGVNAYITNTNPNGTTTAANSSPVTLATNSPGIIPAATPISCSALCANLVVKASAGTLYGFEVAADSTLSGAAWWVMVYNATSAPADGSVTPLKCYAAPSGATTFNGSFTATGITASTGIVIGVSTTGCFTKTASAHAMISGDYQ